MLEWLAIAGTDRPSAALAARGPPVRRLVLRQHLRQVGHAEPTARRSTTRTSYGSRSSRFPPPSCSSPASLLLFPGCRRSCRAAAAPAVGHASRSHRPRRRARDAVRSRPRRARGGDAAPVELRHARLLHADGDVALGAVHRSTRAGGPPRRRPAACACPVADAALARRAHELRRPACALRRRRSTCDATGGGAQCRLPGPSSATSTRATRSRRGRRTGLAVPRRGERKLDRRPERRATSSSPSAPVDGHDPSVAPVAAAAARAARDAGRAGRSGRTAARSPSSSGAGRRG